jgi:predicted CXXCH cytochrome family protein
VAIVPARGAVEGSPHDLIAQGYDVPKDSPLQERCARCHLATLSQMPQEFLSAVPPVLASSYAASSLTCFSCHDGTTIVSPEVDASRTAFHAASHGIHLAGHEGLSDEEVGLPFLEGGRMECITCHDPHGSPYRPLVRLELQELCLACHSTYAGVGRGKENRVGDHPIGFDWVAEARPEVPIEVPPPFRVPIPASYPLQGGKDAPGVHWALGGHLANGDEGTLTCLSCHAVHGDEAAPPRQKLLVLDQENAGANRLCEGCHAGERGDGRLQVFRPNPGGTKTGRTYHPVDDDVANGEGRILEVTIPQGWPVGRGDPFPLLCTTCHVAHGARPATPLLREPVGAETFCESCHTNPLLLYHHPPAGDGACVQYLPPAPEGEPPGMFCGTCHRAHNAGLGAPDEKRFVPLLRDARGTAACTRCHPVDNPTCGSRPEYRASHYLGDPFKDYGDAEPPLRTDPWPESGLPSNYGESESDSRSVTCLSCHSFAKGAITSGDKGKSGHLLARSGNPVEWAEGGESTYLCAGCHSVNPGTGETKGHSHPMMSVDATQLGRPPTLPATLTPAAKVNCDSCHRPHEAVTRGGVYILEAVGSDNTDPRKIHPQIDFTETCRLCHNPGDY